MQDASPNNIGGDVWTVKPKFRITPEEIKHLSQLDGKQAALHIAKEWLGIGLGIFICAHYFNPLFYLIAIMWIGARQHALLILMHEGTHYRLFKNRRLNDWVADVFTAWPLFICNKAYRVDHFAHHQHINTHRDPDWMRKQNAEWEFPKTHMQLAIVLLKELAGFGLVRTVKDIILLAKEPDADGAHTSHTMVRVAYYIAIFSTLIYYGVVAEFFIYWLVPAFTWLPLVLHIRSIAEHFGIPDIDSAYTRTTIPNWFDKLFITANHVNYHIEHHLYPGIPFYNLPRLHNALMQVPGYKEKAHVTHGYINALRECTHTGKHHYVTL